MASIKHFAGNEQETNRMGGNSQIDERTLRELYLLPFDIAVEQGHPASVMCSYNRLNGDYACENAELLTNILKTQWHYPGQVQSDWGATRARLSSRAIRFYTPWPTMTSPWLELTTWCAANSTR
jgi:beta-glucosidase